MSGRTTDDHDKVAEVRPLGDGVSETHISWVFFTPDRAFKILKPVDMPFLDLLAAAQDLQRIAAAGDEAALHDELCRLRNDLAVHIHDEGLHGSASDSLDHRLARHGQQRLLRYVDDLLSTTADLDASESRASSAPPSCALG